MDSLCIYWYKMFLIYTTQIYKLYLGYRCKFDQTLSNSALKILKISRIIYRNCLKEDNLFNFFSICEHIYQHCIYRSISHTEKFNIYTKQIVYFCPMMSKQELCTKASAIVDYVYYYSHTTAKVFPLHSMMQMNLIYKAKRKRKLCTLSFKCHQTKISSIPSSSQFKSAILSPSLTISFISLLTFS